MYVLPVIKTNVEITVNCIIFYCKLLEFYNILAILMLLAKYANNFHSYAIYGGTLKVSSRQYG